MLTRIDVSVCALASLLFLSSRSGAVQSEYVDAAVQAANWLEAVEVETEAGLGWPVAPGESDVVQHNLYHGTSGVVLFLVELNHATGDRLYIEKARRGADELIAAIPDDLGPGDAGLWTGVAGQGFVLYEVYRATGDERYRLGAMRCADLIKQSAEPMSGAGVRWDEVTDIISGASGTGLFLIYCANEMGDGEALELAVRVGDGLLAGAREVDVDGAVALEWDWRRNAERVMPNFSHGTGGVAYYLATLHLELSGREGYDGRFLTAARRGALYLLSIADTEDGGCQIYHHRPEGEELYYLSYCHGPPGTARLFQRLAEADPESGWLKWVERSGKAVLSSGIPESRAPGFWENVGPCCGSAGIGSFALALHRSTADETYLDFAERLHDDIMSRATRVETGDGAVGLKWIQAEHRVRPEFLQSQTGYMQGAAGVGLYLLELHTHHQDKSLSFRLPDSPF